MAISFQNIPDTIRTPGTYAEIDNSQALQGLLQNPHVALIIGQRITAGTKPAETLVSISSDGLADGYFGPGSLLARMCNKFKENNPNTELWAVALSDNAAGVQASATLQTSTAISANGFSTGGAGTYHLMVNGTAVEVAITSGWSTTDVNSAIVSDVNANSNLPCTASTNAASAVNLIAVHKGVTGNYLNVRHNYYAYQSDPVSFSGDSVNITGFAGGTTNPDLGDVWTIIDAERYNYIIQPYTDSSNLTEIEDELEDRIGPLVNQQGHGFTAAGGTAASMTTLGNSRNCPYNTIMGVYDSPNDPAEWAAALGAVAAANLNADPARPLQFLKLKGILPPPVENRFTRAERDVLLYDGIATSLIDSGGNVIIERCITTYQTNALGISDPSYLDVTTLATLGEIRDQYAARMSNRFITQRFKLADDTFPVQPGSKVATPVTIKREIIALFTELRDAGLIENLDDFIENLIVERDSADRNRVNVLLPVDLINQFRILASNLQFIL